MSQGKAPVIGRSKNDGVVGLAQIAVANNCYGMRWEVLDWNQPAIRSYEAIGATFLDQWRGMRLTGGDLKRLAESAIEKEMSTIDESMSR